VRSSAKFVSYKQKPFSVLFLAGITLSVSSWWEKYMWRTNFCGWSVKSDKWIIEIEKWTKTISNISFSRESPTVEYPDVVKKKKKIKEFEHGFTGIRTQISRPTTWHPYHLITWKRERERAKTHNSTLN